MKNKLLKLISVLFLIVILTIRVGAKVAFSGETVSQVGEFDSTTFVAGNKIEDSSKVDGIKFIAGNTIDVTGESPYGFVAGNVITINSKIEKDLFAAGNSLTIGSEAILERDVYLAASTIKINTNVGRNLYVGAGSIDIKGITINGNAVLYGDEVLLDENTVIEGKLTYQKEAKIEGLELAKIGSVEAVDKVEIKIETNFMDTVWSFVISVFAGFVVLLALFKFIPKSKEKLDKLEINIDSVAKSGCSGILVLIIVPIISLFALISGILTPIAIITLLVYGVSIYLSFLIVSYLIGRVVFTKLIKNDNAYLMMLGGILIFRLVGLIPILGGFIRAVALFYGLGLIYRFINNKTSK